MKLAKYYYDTEIEKIVTIEHIYNEYMQIVRDFPEDVEPFTDELENLITFGYYVPLSASDIENAKHGNAYLHNNDICVYTREEVEQMHATDPVYSTLEIEWFLEDRFQVVWYDFAEPLSAEDWKENERFYFDSNSESIMTRSELLQLWNENVDPDGISFEDWVDRLTDPWEGLKEINSISDYLSAKYWYLA